MLSCCNDEQSFFLVTFLLYIISVRILWFSKIMKPFKLWTTFMHEFSHALAAWATCNTVTGIEVNENEGGVTASLLPRDLQKADLVFASRSVRPHALERS